MKIQKEHYQTILDAIQNVNREQALLFYSSLDNNPKVKNKTRAFIWGLYNGTDLLKFTCDVLYKYLNDNHIETALLSACKKLYPDLTLSL